MSDRPRVAVVGAVNVDLVVTVRRLPARGETVTHGEFSTHQGGKGGNQAVAAARALGDAGDVVLVCSVGRDDFGAAALGALRNDGVVIRPDDPTTHRPTGVALILVDASGENQIAVAPGANDSLAAETVRTALDAAAPAVVLASLEVPPEAVTAAAGWCDKHHVPFVLNPAPTDTALVVRIREQVTYLTPNEHELRALGDAPRGVVIETKGSGGAVLHDDQGDTPVAAPVVDVVDTTGAGDCFNGVFAAGIAEGRPLRAAVERAVVAASKSVSARGAREGMPTRAALDGSGAGDADALGRR